MTRAATIRRTPGSRRAGAVALAALAAGALVSCGGLRTPTGVRIDRRVDADAAYDSPDIRRLPAPPAPGTKPEKIAQDFLEAAAGQESDPVVAREFLAPGTAWNPANGTMVYDPGFAGTAVQYAPAAHTVTLTLRQTGIIDPDGAYRPALATVTIVLGVTQVGGEWRVRAIPPTVGLVLTETDVRRDFRPVTVYRLSRVQDALVPDPVELPVTNAALAGAVVRSVLAGPTRWLAPALRTGLPAGTHLADSVTVVGGVASVDLSREAVTMDDRQRDLLLASLAASLLPLPSVDRIRLLVDGRRVLGGDGTVGTEAADLPAADTHWSGETVFVRGGRLVSVTSHPDGQAASVTHPLPGETDLTQPALDGDGDVAALRATPAGDDLVVAMAGRPAAVRVGPADLTGPTWSAGLGVLVGVRGPSPSAVVVRPDGTTVTARVDPGATTGKPLVELRISPDGARVLAVVGRAGARTLWLGRVGETAGHPTIDGWTAVGLPAGVTDVSDVAWLDGLDVAVLSGPAGHAVLWRLPLTATDPTQVTPGLVPADATLVAAMPGAPLLVGDESQVWAQDGGGWRPTGAGTDVTYVR